MSEEKTFIVETSAHHIHVTQETLEELFGDPWCQKDAFPAWSVRF